MGTLEAIVVLVPPLILIGAAIVIAKARPWIRIVTLLAVTAGAAYLAFGLAEGITKATFVSSHLHWFRKYSGYLNHLAEKGEAKELQDTVRFFDQRFQADPSSATNIQDIMYQVLRMGPYREPETTGAPNKASDATSEPAPGAGSSSHQR